MKLNYASSTIVQSNGIQATQAFGIARTPHMFNILSSALYSDPLTAIAREISCNANDAHIMQGTPEQPFEVKLPTPLDRTFHIKDWGPGLDENEVTSLYTTYGASTKQDNDDVTGAFGLGSKSPFAYTMQNAEDSDGFTVVSVKHGIKRIYTCYIGDEGTPCISKLHEGPADADWQHGVMVTFAVQDKDVNDFHRKTAQVVRWFQVKPVVLGYHGSSENLAEPEFRMKGSFFSLECNEHFFSTPAVVMGNVRYPINQSRLGNTLPRAEAALLQAGIHMWVPMGTVMMTPSREELQYTEKTKENVREWLSRAASEIALRICAEVIQAPNESRWAWMRRIQKFATTLPSALVSNIEHFLVSAGCDAEESVRIRRIVNDKIVELPTWIGSGPSKPDFKALQGLDTVLGAPRAFVQEVRVWFYQQVEGRKKKLSVCKREVIRGMVGGNRSDSKVALNVLDDVAVVVGTGQYVDDRIRTAIRNKTIKAALVVTPVKDMATEADVESFAQMISGLQGIEGLPLMSAQSLPRSVSESERAPRPRRGKMSARDYYANETVTLMTESGKIIEKALGELEPAERYWAVCSNFDYVQQAKIWGTLSGGSSERVTLNGRHRDTFMTQLEVLRELLEDLPEIKSIILVPREGTANRLKFEDQDIKPVFDELYKGLKACRAKAEAIFDNMDRIPKVNLGYYYSADDYGWAGVLGHQAIKDSVFWKKFESRFSGTVLHEETMLLVNKARATDNESPADQKAARLEAAFNQMRRIVDGYLVPSEGARIIYGHHEMKERLYSVLPSFRYVTVDYPGACMNDDKEEHHERLLELIGHLLEMDGVAVQEADYRLAA